jgi:hypothetical protein
MHLRHRSPPASLATLDQNPPPRFDRTPIPKPERLETASRSDSNRTSPLAKKHAVAAFGSHRKSPSSQDRNWSQTGQRRVLQVGIDGIAKEFWPNINAKLFRNSYRPRRSTDLFCANVAGNYALILHSR